MIYGKNIEEEEIEKRFGEESCDGLEREDF